MPNIVRLPARFDGRTMSDLTASITRMAAGTRPKELTFDLSTLSFIKPAGVCFLSNVVHWFGDQGVDVFLETAGSLSGPIRYLDDSLFFEQHCGQKLRPFARPRRTTLPLLRLKHERSHSWLRMEFVAWLASRTGVPEAGLHEIQVCVSELFNNIRDHTRLDIGSIFMQHFPQENVVSIAVADFGEGIPKTIRRVQPEATDAEAIVLAVREGVTSHSEPNNAGAGLAYVLRVIVETHGGTVTIYSYKGMVQFRNVAGALKAIRYKTTGLSPGTLVEIELPTRNLRYDDDDGGELEW